MSFKNKKGSTMSFEELIGLVLSVVLLVGLLAIGILFYAFFTGKSEATYSLNNFDRLIEAVNETIGKPAGERTIFPFHVGGNSGKLYSYVLVGFPPYEASIESTCTLNGVKITRDYLMCPLEDSCLCLAKIEKSTPTTLKCQSYKKISGFYVDKDALFDPPYAGEVIDGTAKATLVILGECKLIRWNTRSILIEKRAVPGSKPEIIFMDPEKAKKLASVPRAAQDETVIYGTVSNVDDAPLPYLAVTIEVDGQPYTTITDEDGTFSLPIPKKYDKITDAYFYATLKYNREGKNYFTVQYMKGFQYIEGVTTISDFMDDLTRGKITIDDVRAWKKIPITSNTVELNFKFSGQDTEIKSSQSTTQLENSGVIYSNMHEAVEFALTELNTNIDYKLPVEVIIGNWGGHTFYAQDYSVIGIDETAEDRKDSSVPMNREYHEFSHHIMYSQYRGWPKGSFDINSKNHGGFLNPNTADSWIEGLSEFLPMVMQDSPIYANLGSFENNYRVWDANGQAEELAVAGLLWDMYDTNNDEGDLLTIPFAEIWSVIKEKRANVYEYYNAFKTAFPDKSNEIDQLFIAHGFFADTTMGNGVKDSFEPFRDSNNNKIRDSYEYFVDYGCYDSIPECDIKKIKYEQGDVIGKASNYNRQLRGSAVLFRDAFISVAEKEVWLYKIKVHYNDPSQGTDYEYTSHVQAGLLYVQPLPANVNATILIVPDSKDYTAENIYMINSIEMNQKILDAQGTGSFDSHTFNLIPTGLNVDPPRPNALDSPIVFGDDITYTSTNESAFENITEPKAKEESSEEIITANDFNLNWLLICLVLVCFILVGLLILLKKKRNQ
jgi:hypothetical protein